MTDPAPFLAAVRAGDFFAALIFADWLEERGREKDARRLRGCYRRWERDRANAPVVAARCLAGGYFATRPGRPWLAEELQRGIEKVADRRLARSVAYCVRKAAPQPAAKKSGTSTPSAPASRAAVSRDGASSPRSRRAT
jgi:uncharacterized protein (TIGR02996 family)